MGNSKEEGTITGRGSEFSLVQPPETSMFSGEGLSLYPTPVELPSEVYASPIYTQLHEAWSLQHYLTPREPLIVGDLSDHTAFEHPYPAAVSMPIKLPGSDEVRVPIEYAGLQEVIRACINFEAAINSEFPEYFAYMTVDQRPVKAGKPQRKSGLHIDGHQLLFYPNTYPQERFYLVSDTVPTTLFPGQTIDFSGIDPTASDARAQFNREIERQTDRGRAVIGTPNRLYLLDSCVIHESTTALVDTPRTFFRIAVSPILHNTVGNNGSTSRNPALEYNWSAPLPHMQMAPQPATGIARKYAG
jgi:hypothetical protein